MVYSMAQVPEQAQRKETKGWGDGVVGQLFVRLAIPNQNLRPVHCVTDTPGRKPFNEPRSAEETSIQCTTIHQHKIRVIFVFLSEDRKRSCEGSLR